MRRLLNIRWAVAAVWLVAVVLLVTTAPNMETLVHDKGQISVPPGYSSTLAEELINEANHGDRAGSKTETSDVALVFHDKKTLNKEQLAQIEHALTKLEAEKKALGITEITNPFRDKELQDELISKNKQTVLIPLNVKMDSREPQEVSDALYTALKDTPVEHYFTSSWMVEQDAIESSQEGLKKTEFITVAFILIVLFIVFRSFVAPFIPLLTIGLSYITAESVVAFLVDQFNFPLSTYTQVFLIAILFGTGTDYCILLFSRFKEELAVREDTKEGLFEAIAATYAGSWQAVFFSGLTGFIGFAAIGFSTFNLYQSAAAVAVGFVFLLAALFTVLPFFMAILGKKLFWPAKGTQQHKDNRLWAWTGKFSLSRPFATLLSIALLIAPFLFFYDGNRSFNSLDDVGSGYKSVQGIDIISASFGPGEALPTKVVLKHSEPLDTSAYVALIEKISRQLEATDGVDYVRSATRPGGKALQDLLVAEQAKSLDEGLGDGKKGINDISKGLSEASAELAASAPGVKEATANIDGLIAGTNALGTGIDQLSQALSQLEQGLQNGSAGASELQNGLKEAQANAKKLAKSSKKLSGGYAEIKQGVSSLAEQYNNIAEQLAPMSEALDGVTANLQNIQGLAEKYPELQQDQVFQENIAAAGETVAGVKQGVAQLSGGLKKLNGALAKIVAKFAAANDGMAQTAAGQAALADGFDQLAEGISALKQGVDAAAAGQKEINGNLPALSDGVGQISGGQQQLKDGFTDLHKQLATLQKGLSDSSDGLGEVSEGLVAAQKHLNELSGVGDQDMSGWFITEEALQSEQFQQVFDTYASPDRKTTTFDVILKANPYAPEALENIKTLEEAVATATKQTPLAKAKVAIGGVSSAHHDLDTISMHDYNRTVVIVLLCIGIVLVLLLRSFVMPLYLMVALLLTYFTSLAVGEVIFADVLGYPGLSWPVPFFTFVILVALGVDYSIFLMDRFNEYSSVPVQEAIQTAMRKMGTVIISAVIILGGTFAAMIPSGVISLVQIATVTITGLLLYTLLFLPFFVPVMVKAFGKANWWPFKRDN